MTAGQEPTASDVRRFSAARRRTEPAKLARLVRGELDWIVMTALEKDRTRRYETANGLARDVERHLHDEPVEACPPSATYRLRKLARKHRTAMVTLTGFVAVIGP
jgi:non-specific serine/threonine protein kinase/serine/threonine-protein kinase